MTLTPNVIATIKTLVDAGFADARWATGSIVWTAKGKTMSVNTNYRGEVSDRDLQIMLSASR